MSKEITLVQLEISIAWHQSQSLAPILQQRSDKEQGTSTSLSTDFQQKHHLTIFPNFPNAFAKTQPDAAATPT
eukprot:482762-Hanusia_phi.AAC.1